MPAKRKPGRRPLKRSEKRSHIIAVRFNEREYPAIVKAADGLPIGTWAWRVLLREAGVKPKR